MKNNTFHIPQYIKICHVVGPRMESKPKLLLYRNVVPNLIVMLEYGNLNPIIYVRTWKSDLSTNNNHKHKYYLKSYNYEVIHAI